MIALAAYFVIMTTPGGASDDKVNLNRHQTMLGAYANNFGKSSVGLRYTLQSIWPSGITLK